MRAERTGRFGHTELPEEQREALRRAVRLEIVSIVALACTTVLVGLVLGSSQAMRAAWIEDLLSFLPPIAFLVARSVVRRRPDADHPYGYHRATGIAHLVASVSLLVMGAYLLVDSGVKLVTAEHPAIGGITLFGTTIWLGWLMVAAMALTVPAPIILGRRKMTLAETLHDKVLYADADMNKADWMTAAAAIVGVLGIGVGLWWADSAAAIVIAASIARDGVKNLRRAVSALMDSRARTFDDSEPHPLAEEIDRTLESIRWVQEARSRVRDEGHVFHVESFVVPRKRRMPSLADIEDARQRCIELDWKVQDMIIAPVAVLPDEMLPGIAATGGEN